MIPQYTILIDGGFLLNKLGQKLRSFPGVTDIVSHCDQIKSNPELEKFNLLRIYFYHAPPPAFVLTNPIDKSKLYLNKSSNFKNSARLLESLENLVTLYLFCAWSVFSILRSQLLYFHE